MKYKLLSMLWKNLSFEILVHSIYHVHGFNNSVIILHSAPSWDFSSIIAIFTVYSFLFLNFLFYLAEHQYKQCLFINSVVKVNVLYLQYTKQRSFYYSMDILYLHYTKQCLFYYSMDILYLHNTKQCWFYYSIWIFYICSTLSNDRSFVYLFEVNVLYLQYTKQ